MLNKITVCGNFPYNPVINATPLLSLFLLSVAHLSGSRGAVSVYLFALA